MEAAAQSDRTQAAREATQWMILLQEEPDDLDLRRRFDEWCASSPANAAAWSATEHMSKLATVVLPDYADHLRQPAASRPARRRWLLPLAASAITACIVALVAPTIIVQLRSDHATGTGELRKVALSDGSEVTLAPATNIAVSFTPGERRVRLLAGEAFFAVTPDAARPFKVEAGPVEATVLGTRFDVSRDSDGVMISVEAGAVGVNAAFPGASERLEPGQSVRMTWTGEVRRASQAPQLMASWRRGQLHLQDQTLREAIDRLSGYFNGSIVLTDAALGNLQVTGAYNLRSPEEALRGMAEVLGVRVRLITPWLLVVSGS